MTSTFFFDNLQNQLDNKLPFVAYSKSKSFEIRALLQKNQSLYKVDDFSESGFVFSPFDIRKDTLLIPLSMSRTMVTQDDVVLNDFDSFKKISTENEKAYIDLVNKGIKAITSENLEKVVVSRVVEIKESNKDVILIFKRLLLANNSAFVYCWYHPKVGLWLGATPETLLKVEGNEFSTMALAGTQKFMGTMDVRWTDKEVNEQQIVTDYLKSNLEPITNKLTVSPSQTIRAGNLLHIQNELRGSIHGIKSGLQKLIYTLHPTPAVCGFPKIEAMQFILDNEHYNREFYTGFLGELNREVKVKPRTGKLNIENRAFHFNKRASHLFVNLRCAQLDKEVIKLYVGGGVTRNSQAKKEWEETIAKMYTMSSVLS